MKGSNFPQELLQVFLGHSAELSRQCVEPPLRKKPGYVRLLSVLTSCTPLFCYPALYTAGLNSFCLSIRPVCSSVPPSPFFLHCPSPPPSFPFFFPLISTVPPSTLLSPPLPPLLVSLSLFSPFLSSLLSSLLPFISCLHSDPPFSPKPSLQLLANYLVVECTRRYPQEKCPLCSETALPEDPKVSTQPLFPKPHSQFRASFPVPGSYSQYQGLIPSPHSQYQGLIPSPHSQYKGFILSPHSQYQGLIPSLRVFPVLGPHSSRV